jgi:transposase
MKPTYDELAAKVQHLEELLKKALEKIAKLEEQLGCNSKNSSKPPSTDQKSNTLDKQKHPRSSRAGVARVLYPPERIDKRIECWGENCPHCSSQYIQWNGESPALLQQAELPEVKAVITQYELQKYTCLSCHKHSIAPLPNGVPNSAFGPRLMGLLATLTGVMHLAKREAIQLIKDLYDVDMGIGSVPNVEERVSASLNPVYDQIHKFILQHMFCTYFDETGWRDKGKRHFVWLAACPHAAVYRIDRNRSAAAFQRLIGGKTWDAPAVTDRYAVYSSFQMHQFCLAHLIREFKRYGERDGPDKSIGTALENELRLSCKIHGQYREDKISLVERNRRLGARKRRVEYWLSDGLANGSDALSKICGTLLEDFEKLWTFTKTLGMEPTNNLAERDLRKLVIWRRKSYGTRSERGKKFVERITTVAQTIRKHGGNVLHFVQQSIMCFYLRNQPPLISEAMGF